MTVNSKQNHAEHCFYSVRQRNWKKMKAFLSECSKHLICS